MAPDHSLALTEEGEAYAWGNNRQGQLADGTWETRLSPVRVKATHLGTVVELDDIAHIAAGQNHSLAVLANGAIFVCGAENFSDIDPSSGPHFIANFDLAHLLVFDETVGEPVLSIACGYQHCLIAYGARLLAWGLNDAGQLGDETLDQRREPADVTRTAKKIRAVAAGRFHSMALDKGGKVWTWGANTYRQLGRNATAANRVKPTRLTTPSDIVAIAAGADHSLALDKDGKVWGWGLNNYGQLGVAGLSGSVPVATPRTIQGLSNIGYNNVPAHE